MCLFVTEQGIENRFGLLHPAARTTKGESILSTDFSAELHSIVECFRRNSTDDALVEETSAASAGPSHTEKLPVFLKKHLM